MQLDINNTIHWNFFGIKKYTAKTQKIKTIKVSDNIDIKISSFLLELLDKIINNDINYMLTYS